MSQLRRTTSLILLSASLLASCDSTPASKPTIRFILPKGYRQKFELVVDTKVGLHPTVNEGVYEIRVSDSGVVAVSKSTHELLSNWHKEEFVYLEGDSFVPIPWFRSGGSSTMGSHIETKGNRTTITSQLDGTRYTYLPNEVRSTGDGVQSQKSSENSAPCP